MSEDMRGFFFLRKKKQKLEKKNHVCSSYLGGIFFQLFFFGFEKNIPKKSDEHGWVFFSQKKKTKTEKNTQACLWNMRGSLPLLFLSREFFQRIERRI